MKKISGVLLFLFFLSSGLFASYSDALKLFEKKEYKKSLAVIADELTVADDMKDGSPNFKQRFLAAHNHWKLGNTKSAIAHFKRCMDIKKESVAPYIDLSYFLIDLKRYSDAKKILRKGLKIKKSSLLYFLLGRINLKRGNYWKAKGYYEKANALDAELFVSYNELGVTLMHLKKYSEANTAFSVAHALAQTNAEILNNLALSLEKLGKLKEAEEILEKADSINDGNGRIHRNMLDLQKRLKNAK